MRVHPGSSLWLELEQRYEECCTAMRSGDVDGFLRWAGPEGSFIRQDGTTGRWSDTRPFWEWRFSQILEVVRFDIELEDVSIGDDGLVVVDFHEVSRLSVRNFDGAPAVRVADLHNRNWWRRAPAGLSIVNGAEPRTRRTLDGKPIEDPDDPIGFSAWGRLNG